MNTDATLLSISKLLAFACLQLSLLLLGVAELVRDVSVEGGALLLFAGVACLLVSAVWLFQTATMPTPATFEESGTEVSDANEHASTGSGGEHSGPDVESD